MRVVTAEEVDAHVMKDLIEFFVLSEVVSVDPHTHSLTMGVTLLNDFASQFHRRNVYTSALFGVNRRVRQLI